jgi:hypothetical protein
VMRVSSALCCTPARRAWLPPQALPGPGPDRAHCPAVDSPGPEFTAFCLTMFGLFSSSNSSKGIEDDLMNLKLSAKQLKRESAKSEKEMAKAKEQVKKVSPFEAQTFHCSFLMCVD